MQRPLILSWLVTSLLMLPMCRCHRIKTQINGEIRADDVFRLGLGRPLPCSQACCVTPPRKPPRSRAKQQQPPAKIFVLGSARRGGGRGESASANFSWWTKVTIYDSQPSPGGAFTCVPAAPCAECTDTALLTALLLNKQELEKHKYSLMARVSAAKMSKSPPSAASFVCRQSGSVVSCHVWTLKVSTKFCYCRKEGKYFSKFENFVCNYLSYFYINTLVEICLRIMDITKCGHYGQWTPCYVDRQGLKTCTFNQ